MIIWFLQQSNSFKTLNTLVASMMSLSAFCLLPFNVFLDMPVSQSIQFCFEMQLTSVFLLLPSKINEAVLLNTARLFLSNKKPVFLGL